MFDPETADHLSCLDVLTWSGVVVAADRPRVALAVHSGALQVPVRREDLVAALPLVDRPAQ